MYNIHSLLRAGLRLRPARIAAVLAVTLTWSGFAFCGEIHDAIASDKLEKVKALLKDNPDLVSSKEGERGDEFTPLTVAVYVGDKGMVGMVELLLANKADVNAKGRDGKTPLHFAAEGRLKMVAEVPVANAADYKRVAELLLANKADVNAEDNIGDTPLHLAARTGNAEVAEVLLANKADVNAGRSPRRNKFHMFEGPQETPLHESAYGGHDRVVDLLLANKAGVDPKNTTGNTPLVLAVEQNHAGIVKRLLKAGADKDAIDVHSPSSGLGGDWPVLCVAADHGYAEVVKLLLDAGADTEAKDREDLYLVNREALNDPKAPAVLNVNHGTALIHAANGNHADIVKMLIDARANKDAQDYWRHTAMGVAKAKGYEAVSKVLSDADSKK